MKINLITFFIGVILGIIICLVVFVITKENYYDYADKFFYDVLKNTYDVKIPKMFQAIKWNTFLKFRSWANLFVLWGKTASDEQAAEVVKKIIKIDNDDISITYEVN